MADHLLESFEDGIATLTMNRPEARNAMSGQMMAGLAEAIPRLAKDPNVRCVVLTGAGGAFSSGGDVKGFAADVARGSGTGASVEAAAAASSAVPAGNSVEARARGLRGGMEIVRILHEMPKPTLAIIPGPAAGAGLSLALACDLRFCLDTAKITTAFSKIGGSGDYGGSYFLPYLVGAARARELYFLADIITGQQALEIGLVNRVASAENFEAESRAFARQLASLPTVAIGYMKENLNAAFTGNLGDVLDKEALNMMKAFTTEDHKRAVMAFVKKEPPQFVGR